MKQIHIRDFCNGEKGRSQEDAGKLLGMNQAAVSKMIRVGRAVYLEFTDEDEFVRAFEHKTLINNQPEVAA